MSIRPDKGIVAKHKAAPYVLSPATWFKVLNKDYSQNRGRKKMTEARPRQLASAKSIGGGLRRCLASSLLLPESTKQVQPTLGTPRSDAMLVKIQSAPF